MILIFDFDFGVFPVFQFKIMCCTLDNCLHRAPTGARTGRARGARSGTRPPSGRRPWAPSTGRTRRRGCSEARTRPRSTKSQGSPCFPRRPSSRSRAAQRVGAAPRSSANRRRRLYRADICSGNTGARRRRERRRARCMCMAMAWAWCACVFVFVFWGTSGTLAVGFPLFCAEREERRERSMDRRADVSALQVCIYVYKYIHKYI